jgi:ankyrin repeat protein
MSRILPEHPSLEHLKKQAKELLRAVDRGAADAVERFRAVKATTSPRGARLTDAQHVIAREYGFTTWARLKAHVESSGSGAGPMERFAAAVREHRTAEARTELGRHPELRARLDEALPGMPFGGTALICAAQHSDREMTEFLLEAGADINGKSHWWAGGFGVLDQGGDLVPYLIERGATVDAYAASRLGMLDRLEHLVAADPNAVHTRGGDGQTPLHVARSVEVARFLLDHGAEIDAQDVDHESTAAQYLVRERQDVARFLVARGASTDILMAAAFGDLARVRDHLDADPSCIRMRVSPEWFPMRDPKAGGTIYTWTLGAHKTAHRVAREFGHEEIVRYLLDQSPDEFKLAQACELGDESLFQALLAARPDLARSLTDAERRSLASAAEDNNTKAVRLMLKAGWPLDGRGAHGGTALHWAAWHGNAALVREILQYDPPVDLRGDAHDMTALGWALHGSQHSWHRATGEYGAVVESLLRAGAHPPELTPELDASAPALEALSRHLAGGD